MSRRRILQAAAAPRVAFAQSQRAICYNCPPEWTDWGGICG